MPWFRDGTPLVVFCRHCSREVTMQTAFPPERCPYCYQEKKDEDKWWTVDRPDGKTIKGVLSEDDRNYLRCERIEPWKGGVDD